MFVADSSYAYPIIYMYRKHQRQHLDYFKSLLIAFPQ